VLLLTPLKFLDRSQFPLTFEGATLFAESFYTNLLKGEDAREALATARCALFASRESNTAGICGGGPTDTGRQ
jgi:hypothetical protein